MAAAVVTITIDDRFRGPPRSGNGGYVCGLLAQHFDGPVTVRLLAPPPLGKPLSLDITAQQVILRDGDRQLATAQPAVDFQLQPPAVPSYSEAEAASQHFLGFRHHPFPGCFVCGPQRAAGDGLRIFTGPTAQADCVAAPWLPDRSLAEGERIAPQFLWAALDCPGAFAQVFPPADEAIVLGELTARIEGDVAVDERCIAIGWQVADLGRRRVVGSALLRSSGEVIAVAQATWFIVPASLFA